MTFFGCLPFLVIGLAVITFLLLGKILNLAGATVIYIWESFCNLFRKKENRIETHNPFGERRYYNRTAGYEGTEQQPKQPKPNEKRYSANDGEYVDFEEIKD